MGAPVQGRCAAVLMFRHQLAVLPAMAAGDPLGEGLDELLDDSDVTNLVDSRQRGGAGRAGGAAAASLGNSYVLNLGTLGIREVSIVVVSCCVRCRVRCVAGCVIEEARGGPPRCCQ